MFRQGTLTNPDARRLFHEANCADWAPDPAVVSWVGFDAPNNATDPGLYQPNLARAGGQAFAADVNALAVTHQGAPAHVTAVGHSYRFDDGGGRRSFFGFACPRCGVGGLSRNRFGAFGH